MSVCYGTCKWCGGCDKRPECIKRNAFERDKDMDRECSRNGTQCNGPASSEHSKIDECNADD